MIALGLDTSNYATSVAVVDTTRMEVVCAKKEFLPVPQGQCGLRQSDAVFQHTKALPGMLHAMEAQGVLPHVKAVGVSVRPRPQPGSYMPCFLAGYSAAQAAALVAGLPLHETSHQQGHLAAALFGAGLLAAGLPKSPFLLFHCSGGTTELLYTRGFEVLSLVGKSLDLYAGQAVDRLGVRLGYGFPAGEALSGLALECREHITPKLSLSGVNCHLSGLQNQCEALLRAGKPPAYVAKYCLLAVAHTALAMIAEARRLHGPLPVLCAGGVMGSVLIRREMEERETGLHFVPPAFSSDNAVGIACIAGLGGRHGDDTGNFCTE